MKKEKPIKTIKYPAKKGARRHSYETRIFAREIHEIFCTDKKCEFYQQHAQQGVCYSNKPEITDWPRIEALEKQVRDETAAIRKKYKGKEYIRWLEAMYQCAQMNWTFVLDEVVRLRRDLALIQVKKSRAHK